jgi:hypothetical protein
MTGKVLCDYLKRGPEDTSAEIAHKGGGSSSKDSTSASNVVRLSSFRQSMIHGTASEMHNIRWAINLDTISEKVLSLVFNNDSVAMEVHISKHMSILQKIRVALYNEKIKCKRDCSEIGVSHPLFILFVESLVRELDVFSSYAVTNAQTTLLECPINIKDMKCKTKASTLSGQSDIFVVKSNSNSKSNSESSPISDSPATFLDSIKITIEMKAAFASLSLRAASFLDLASFLPFSLSSFLVLSFFFV